MSAEQDNKLPKTKEDLEKLAYEKVVKDELKPLLHEINERINRLDVQEHEGQPPQRDIYGKSAYDYTMIKYKCTLGDLRDDPVGQLKLVRPLFTGLGKSVVDEKEEADRLAKVNVNDKEGEKSSGKQEESQVKKENSQNKPSILSK